MCVCVGPQLLQESLDALTHDLQREKLLNQSRQEALDLVKGKHKGTGVHRSAGSQPRPAQASPSQPRPAQASPPAVAIAAAAALMEARSKHSRAGAPDRQVQEAAENQQEAERQLAEGAQEVEQKLVEAVRQLAENVWEAERKLAEAVERAECAEAEVEEARRKLGVKTAEVKTLVLQLRAYGKQVAELRQLQLEAAGRRRGGPQVGRCQAGAAGGGKAEDEGGG